jgi:hypothetical protein
MTDAGPHANPLRALPRRRASRPIAGLILRENVPWGEKTAALCIVGSYEEELARLHRDTRATSASAHRERLKRRVVLRRWFALVPGSVALSRLGGATTTRPAVRGRRGEAS